MNSVMEFILRMKDEASAGIQRVKASITGTKDAAQQAKPGLEGMAGSVNTFSESFKRAQGVMMGVLGVIGLVVAAFKVSYDTAKKVMEWSGVFPAAEALKQAQKTLEEAAQTKQALSDFDEQEKRRMAELTDEYDRQAGEVGKLTAKLDALAAAKQKVAASELNQRMTQIGADEQYALAQGYDPEAVKIQYADERRKVQADAGIADAQSAAEASARAVADAEESYKIKVNRSLALQDAVNQAQYEKAAALKDLNALDKEETSPERLRKMKNALYRDSKANVTLARANTALDSGAAGEEAAAAAVEVAKALAEASNAAVADAMTTRSAAEFAYQADVQAFWAKRDEDNGAANQAALDAVKEQMAERKKLADEQIAAEHARRVEDIKAEAALGEQSAAAAQDRLSRAHAAAQTAWGWYRDPESFKRQRAEEEANKRAETQFAKDSKSLTSRSGWRDARLDDRQESVRRVVLAREEERAAQTALTQIEVNTRGLAQKLEQLLSMK